MFGIFKKKENSKTIQKSIPIAKDSETKSNAKAQKIINQTKNKQKQTSDQRHQTEGQFIPKKKVSNHFSQEKKFKINNIPTPKIQTKKKLRQIQQKDTERPQKILTLPYDFFEQKKFNELSKQKSYSHSNREQFHYDDIEQKEKISLQLLKTTLEELKTRLEQQNQLLMTKELKKNVSLREIHNKLFYTKYFRFYHLNSSNELRQRYGYMLQSLQILTSKLMNRIGKGVHFHKTEVPNEQKLQVIYVRNESDFLLFFKHFFSKPYTLCNRPSTRKVIQVLWQSVAFKQSNYNKLYEQIKLWIYGISVPTNPTLIMLHKTIFNNVEALPKYAKMICNQKIYMGVNETDPILKTPLLLAVELGNKKAIQKLIKCGADPHLSPCYLHKGSYSFELSETKNKKHLFSLTFPQYNKKVLSPLQTLLFVKQDFSLLNDCFYSMELANIRRLKKEINKIKELLQDIPDCTFQIHWKTTRGILSFKELPSDIITIYKKKSWLRIDYNINDIQNSVKGKHFTILIKVKNQKQLQFYEIRHHNKTILNRLCEVDMNVIKMRLNQFCRFPQLRNADIVQCKGGYEKKNGKIKLEMNLSMQRQFLVPQIKKNTDYKNATFNNLSQYERSILESELIDYKSFSTSQVNAVQKQTIVNQKLLPVKLKSKVQKSSVGLEIQLEQQILKLKHFFFVISLFKPDSDMFARIEKYLNLIQNDDVFVGLNLHNYLPTLTKINSDKDLSFQAQIKNLNYISTNDNVFNVECRVVADMSYEQNLNPHALDSLQETVLMEQGCTINVSQFLGKSQQIIELQQQYAKERFEKMLQEAFVQSSRNKNFLAELQEDD